MRLISQFSGVVYWRIFNIGDRTFGTGVRDGVLRPGDPPLDFRHPSAETFSLELKRDGLFGPFIKRPGDEFANGDLLILRGDGQLERQPDGDYPNQPPPPPPVVIERRVQRFNVAEHGFKFPNNFPMTAFPVQEVAGFRITNTAFGLCGGMVYAACDYFLAARVVPPRTDPPTGGKLFDFLWRRLVDSFNLPLGAGNPARYLHFMDPNLPDAGAPGLSPAGRSWAMINEEWPKVREAIDADRLCPIALVTTKSPDPGKIFYNHQVLVYGYRAEGPVVTLLIYDPNVPCTEATLRVDLSDANAPPDVTYSHGLPAGSDGRVHFFMRTDYGYVTPPRDQDGPEWEPGWRSIGRMVASAPDIASMHAGELSVFALGYDNRLWTAQIEGDAWGPWVDLGGDLKFSPGAVSWGPERLDIFAVGSDNCLKHTYYANHANGWGDWESFSAFLTSAPDVCSMARGRLDVFVKGHDNALWHLWYAEGTGWSNWESLGGFLTSGPSAVSWGPNRIDVFACGPQSQLHHIWFDGSWHDWQPVGRQLAVSEPDACSPGPGCLDVFAVGLDGGLKHLSFSDNTWHDWQNLGGLALSTSPSAISRRPGQIDVVARGADFGLWMKRYA